MGTTLDSVPGGRCRGRHDRAGLAARGAAAVLAVALAGALSGCTGNGLSSGGAAPSQGASPSGSASQPGGDMFGRIPTIVRQVQPSVVSVLTDSGQGSGVVWSRDGTIVTDDHVVADASRIQVAFADGRRVAARVRAADQITDLAVLQADRKGLPAARFATSLPVVGDLAIAMGNPLGFENSVTAGIVSGLGREIPGSAPQSQALVDLIQTDAPISPGNSGGALVAADGKVMGINEAFIPPGQGAVSIGFAIPAPTVVGVVTQLLANGKVSHAYLGVSTTAITPEIASEFGLSQTSGALVTDVQAGQAAAKAGVQPGDVIVSLGGKDVASPEDLVAALRAHKPGERVPLVVVRGGDRRTLTATLSQRPG